MASNSASEKKLGKLEYPKGKKNEIKSYLTRLGNEVPHARWITVDILFHFDCLHATHRQFQFVVMWVKRKFKVDLSIEFLTVPTEQG